MSVRKRDKRWLVDFLYLDSSGAQIRFRRSLGRSITSRRQAEWAEAQLRAEFAQKEREAKALVGTPGELPPAAFSGFAAKWYELHVVQNCKPSVHARYESILRVHLVPFFGDRVLTEIGPLQVEEFKSANRQIIVKHTGNPPSPKTVNEHLGVLSSLMEAACRWGYLHNNPCRRVARLKLPPATFQ